MMYVKRWKGLRMSCDVGEVMERLENELTYVTAHSPTLPLLYLRHSSFFNPSFASPTLQALHLIHLASRPRKEPLWRASIPGIYRIPRFLRYVTWRAAHDIWAKFHINQVTSLEIVRGPEFYTDTHRHTHTHTHTHIDACFISLVFLHEQAWAARQVN